MTKKKLIEDIKHNPARFYRAPSDVKRDRRFSDEERLEILAAWEREERASSHDDADMGEGDIPRLQQVVDVRCEVEKKLPPREPYREPPKIGPGE